MLPSPLQNDFKSGRVSAATLKKNSRPLRDVIESGMCPNTPTASDAEGGVMEVRSDCHGKYKLRDMVPHVTGGKSHGLKLQPAFAEWMMGYPEGYTALTD
jgi:hypothetical protein